MASVKFSNITKKFGENTVLSVVDLEVSDREFVVVVGPSGCGKTTLLRMLAGLEEITGGEIAIDGGRVNELHPSKRGIAMVFQDYALYPHMTAEENMSFSLRLAGLPPAEITERVREAAGILQLDKLLKRMPRELSGGQRQRVAIGRAIVRKPRVFLFDEPLSNLDAKLREEMRVELARLHSRLEATIIYVTHDQVEAMTLATRIVVMNKGVIQQAGPPLEVYRKPSNLFTAGFIGSPTMNLFSGKISGNSGALFFESADFTVPLSGEVLTSPAAVPGKAAVLGVRPDDVLPGKAAAGSGFSFGAVLEVSELLGHRENLYLRAGSSRIVAVTEAFFNHSPGSQTEVSFRQSGLHLFDTEGLRL